MRTASKRGLDGLGEVRQFVGEFVRFGGRRLWKAGVLVGIGSLVEGASLILIIPLLQIVGDGADGSGRAQSLMRTAGIDGRLEQIGLVLGLFAVGLLLRTVLLAKRQLVVAELECGFLTEIQTDLIAALGRAQWSVVARLRHARVTHILSSDVYRVGLAAAGLLESGIALIMMVVQFGLALAISPVLTLAGVAVMAIAGLLAAPLGKAARDIGRYATAANLSLLNDAAQFLSALKLAVSQNLQPRFVADFATTLNDLAAEELRFVRRENQIRFRMTIVAVLTVCMTAFIGFGLMRVPAVTLIALLLVLSRISGPINQLHNQMLETIRAFPAFTELNRLRQDLGSPEPPDLGQAAPAGDIVLRNVRYLHTGQDAGQRRPGLTELTLTIPAGSLFGIAGPSGAGKTTLADLLVGLYAPQSGTIAVGDAPVRLDRRSAWRDRLSYVSQDSFLKNDTVLANLLWARPDATEPEIARVLRLSGADLVVARLADGIETVVGERGGLISGGERQRIAIARALLRKPNLLILDEATNAIDVIGEQTLLRELAALRPAVTIVIIAHRLESLSLCDTIAVIDEGRLAAQGPFEDLRELLGRVELRAPRQEQRVTETIEDRV